MENMFIPTRKLNWKSCLDSSGHKELMMLQEVMKTFYSSFHQYYSEIDYAACSWTDNTQLEAQDILREASLHEAVLDVGCGRANILKTGKIDQRNYTGIDFSAEIIAQNRITYPDASFYCIEDPSRFPVADDSYDYIFSHYVLEHCVFPNLFLNECVRALRPDGLLTVICPDFLGAGRISSQRVGFSEGTGRQKLSQGRYWDALVTGFDNKIKIPLYASLLRIRARNKAAFFINMAPTCLTDRFITDIDAVYLTFEDEIRNYLAESIQWDALDDSLKKYCAKHAHIYLKGRKLPNE
jgi:SAM-dependent methyltransferase